MTFQEELNHLLQMIEADVGEAWQQLRGQASRVRSMMEEPTEAPATIQDISTPDPEPVWPEEPADDEAKDD